MPRTVFLYVLLVTLLITGCGPASMPKPLNTPTPEPVRRLDDQNDTIGRHHGTILFDRGFIGWKLYRR